MGKTTSIEWTKGEDGNEGATWTPIRAINVKTRKKGWHCEHDSPGCANCYSEAQNKWTGTGYDFRPAYLMNGDVELFMDHDILQQPTIWDGKLNIFVCSMTDLFGSFMKTEWIDAVFAVMAICAGQHTFDVLTKREARLLEYLKDPATPGRIAAAAAHFAGRPVRLEWPMPHVRVGVSIEDKRRAERRFPPICEIGEIGWKTMVSLEPLLEEVRVPERYLALGKRAWAVVGGESGRNARPCALRNIRMVIRDCLARIAVFTKQLGAHPIEGEIEYAHGQPRAVNAKELKLVHPKGGDPAEWAEDLRIQQIPER